MEADSIGVVSRLTIIMIRDSDTPNGDKKHCSRYYNSPIISGMMQTWKVTCYNSNSCVKYQLKNELLQNRCISKYLHYFQIFPN